MPSMSSIFNGIKIILNSSSSIPQSKKIDQNFLCCEKKRQIKRFEQSVELKLDTTKPTISSPLKSIQSLKKIETKEIQCEVHEEETKSINENDMKLEEEEERLKEGNGKIFGDLLLPLVK